MSASLDTALSILGQEVPLGRVDKALKELWGADQARDKASLMNFAIYSEDPDSITSNTRLLGEITLQHACRALLILNLPGDPPPQARAWVTAHCQLYDGRKSVCSEQISFLLTGGHANQIRNIVFAHLDSDLPLVCWWQGNLSEHFDERFYSFIDLLFIDSSCWTDPAANFDKLLQAHSENGARFRVYDLSWLRSHYIRTALATCFYDPLALAELPKVKGMVITHAAGHRVAGLLLAAWVGVRLKASLQTVAGGPALVLPEGQTIALEIKEGAGEEALESVVLRSDDATFRISRACGSSYICTHVELPGFTREHMLPADLPTDSALITNLLSRLGRQSLYLNMVPMLRQMLDMEQAHG